MPSKSERRAGPWTLEPAGSGGRLTYGPTLSDERFVLALSKEQASRARALAAHGDAAGLRDLLLGEEERARAIQGAATSALVAANTWRWALPLFGGPWPARRSGG